jgi:hypothetical protein
VSEQLGVAISLGGLAITMIVGFTKVIRATSRIELKMELVWADYMERHGLNRPEGRRRGVARIDGRD